MITISKIEKERTELNGKLVLAEFSGLSTDTKPTNEEDKTYPVTLLGDNKIDNGSMFIEIDTGKLYMYDLENEEWSEL